LNYGAIRFGGEVRRLLRDTTQRDVFRIDEATVGVTNGPLSKAILAARPMHDFERIVFKPVKKRPVSKVLFAAVMKAIGQDARRVANDPEPAAFDLRGVWPAQGHIYLRARLYSGDPWVVRAMASNAVNRSTGLQGMFEAISSRILATRSLPQEASALAKLTETLTGDERRSAITLYRRAAQSVCSTVAGLATSVLWLGAPFDQDARLRDCIMETLRLLPPAWLFLRTPGKEFAELDHRIREADDVLVIPLLTQRDPAVWSEPDLYRPARWESIDDPEAHDHYLPFGHGTDRCWARELVLMLTEHIVREVTRQRLRVDPAMHSVTMPMRTLLTIARLDLVAA
jgi:Cytochrome P450